MRKRDKGEKGEEEEKEGVCTYRREGLNVALASSTGSLTGHTQCVSTRPMVVPMQPDGKTAWPAARGLGELKTWPEHVLSA